MQKSIIGIPWYSEEDYPEIIDIMQDSRVFHAHYSEWQEKVHHLEYDYFMRGIVAYRARIRPKDFLIWCAARELEPDIHARIIFANEYAYRRATNFYHRMSPDLN